MPLCHSSQVSIPVETEDSPIFTPGPLFSRKHAGIVVLISLSCRVFEVCEAITSWTR